MSGYPDGWHLIAAIALAAWAVPGRTAGISCTAALGTPAVISDPLTIHGVEPTAMRLPVVPGHAYLIEVRERDKDALVELLDSKNLIIIRADHPERRTGTRRSVVTAPGDSLAVRVTGKEPAGAVGTAEIRVFDLAALRGTPDCLAALTALAQADSDYAAGEDISAGRPVSYTGSARDAFLHAVAGYSAAERALIAPADQWLRGQAALALAGIEYFDLQDWANAADWAKAAERMLGSSDLYRRTRADALLAAAWIEIGSAAPTGRAAPGHAADSTGLLARARTLLQRLKLLHLKRGEKYDAGLQQANIALTYLYEGRYPECIAASGSSSRLFGSIHERLRQAEAWQDRALCLWGLGRLREASRWFEGSLKQIGPAPFPTIYLAAITNTALADYALGHFDDSLRLYDRALAFTEKIQSPRDEAYCLYGIGVNYYALGDRERARRFLERSLAIRTAALDGLGRLASLRALATIEAEQGKVEQALASDREALSLSITPSSIARIEIQLAAHTAAAGRLTEAKAQLDQVIARGVKADPAIQAEALLQRAVLLRTMGRPREALADLAAARPRLHAFGSVSEEFEAELELARVLRLTGQPDAALAADDRALGHADAVRLQTANPELRAQLQTPLRAAYDLKLELLRGEYDRAVAAGQDKEANALAIAAFTTADSARAHSFADVAAQRYPSAIRRALASEFRRRETLYRELAARRFALDTRLDRSGPADPGSKHLLADIGELQREVDTVNTLIATHSTTEDKQARSGHERRSVPILPANTALISYWLGSESAYAWVVLAGKIHWSRLSSPAAIAAQAAALHRSLTRLVDIPVERRLQDARALHELIVRPLEPWLSDVGRWVIVPDGALDYVPFAALRSGDTAGSFVAQRHDIALAPAVWTLDTTGTPDRGHGRRGLLLVADPVYEADDPRLVAVKGSWKNLRASPASVLDRGEYRRLPFAGEEAVKIAAQFPPTDVDQLIGLDATRDRMLSLDWSAYRFIHIATHGIVDAQVPQLSALILGSYDPEGRVGDDAVRVADVSLQTLAADVVVLSACETALGKEVSSEGLVGLGSTMLARGARAVVASLWPVPDEIGARLMTEFYGHLLQESMSPETALGTAMRSVLSRDRSADPALWAAFQVSVASLGPSRLSAAPAHTKVATATRP